MKLISRPKERPLATHNGMIIASINTLEHASETLPACRARMLTKLSNPVRAEDLALVATWGSERTFSKPYMALIRSHTVSLIRLRIFLLTTCKRPTPRKHTHHEREKKISQKYYIGRLSLRMTNDRWDYDGENDDQDDDICIYIYIYIPLEEGP